jgi:uncharacterized protein YjbI with pentapeptide repeats
MKIVNRYTGKVILEIAGDSLIGADLRYASFSRADLTDANFFRRIKNEL